MGTAYYVIIFKFQGGGHSPPADAHGSTPNTRDGGCYGCWRSIVDVLRSITVEELICSQSTRLWHEFWDKIKGFCYKQIVLMENNQFSRTEKKFETFLQIFSILSIWCKRKRHEQKIWNFSQDSIITSERHYFQIPRVHNWNANSMHAGISLLLWGECLQ